MRPVLDRARADIASRNTSVTRTVIVAATHREAAWLAHIPDHVFRQLLNSRYLRRGRNDGYPSPPAQIRTGSIAAYGSYLGWVASKRTFG